MKKSSVNPCRNVPKLYWSEKITSVFTIQNSFVILKEVVIMHTGLNQYDKFIYAKRFDVFVLRCFFAHDSCKERLFLITLL